MAALGVQSGISKSQVSRICQEIDEQVQAFLSRPLQESGYGYGYLDATYLHRPAGQGPTGRLRRQPIGHPDERLDKSIGRIHRKLVRCRCTFRMTTRYSTLFTLRSEQSGLGFYTTQRDAAGSGSSVHGWQKFLMNSEMHQAQNTAF